MSIEFEAWVNTDVSGSPTINISGTNLCTGDFAPPKPPKPEFGAEFWEQILDARILDPDSWVKFFDTVFSSRRGPRINSHSNQFTSQNSPFKIQPRNLEKIFTLHLCRAIWLTIYCNQYIEDHPHPQEIAFIRHAGGGVYAIFWGFVRFSVKLPFFYRRARDFCSPYDPYYIL